MIALALILAQDSLTTLTTNFQLAVESKNPTNIRKHFVNQKDADYLIESLSRTPAGKVIAFKAPQGWTGTTNWITVSNDYELEQDHETVFPVINQAGVYKLGPEIREDETAKGARITHADIAVKLDHVTKVANVAVDLKIEHTDQRAIIFRLNPSWQSPSLSNGELERVGGLLIWTPKGKGENLSLTYGSAARISGWEHFKVDYAYLLSYWVPSLGRLPHTTDTTVYGPKGWEIRSEGNLKPLDANKPVVKRIQPSDEFQGVHYQCDIPISYPKVVAGAYKLAAEKKVGSRTFRSWMFTVDKARGEFDVNRMAEFAEFCDKTLIEWPFPGYESFDAKDFYGIESYSYTLLAPFISSRYVAHEMGHTYFGGIAPCPYVNDSWNEGVTTYVDDVLTGRMVDRPIEQGYATATYPKPLDKMGVAHGDNGISYPRGSYVMKMLEAEIGKDKVIEGLRLLLKGQVGKDTRWTDLRPYFEQSGKKPLDWFWKQWVESAVFPKIELASSVTDRVNGRYRVKITLRQSGTPQPFRIKLGMTLDGGNLRVIELKNSEQVFTIDGLVSQPKSVKIDPIGYTMAQVEGRLKGEVPIEGN